MTAEANTGAGTVRKLPPVAELAVVAVALMLTGGIDLAAQVPGRASLVVPTVFATAGAVLTLADLVMLSRIRPFAWSTFFLVIRWALAAYLVIAGLLEYVFVFDHTPPAALAVLTATLVVFAVDVPTVLAFTVARHQQRD